MDKIKLAIAEDHEKFKRNIVKYLQSTFDERIEIKLEASDGVELLQKLKLYTPDIILMSIRLPIMCGIEATKIVRSRYPKIKIIAISQFDLEDDILVMNRLGVESFIDKRNYQLLEMAIDVVHKGHFFFPGNIARVIQSRLPETYPDAKSGSLALSDFEVDLLKLIGKGLSSTQIGDRTCRSPRTIEDYRERLYKKFRVDSKERLIIEAIRKNII